MRQSEVGDPRADDGGLYRSALALVRRRTGVDIAFGGRVVGDALRLSEFQGALTGGLAGLRVARGLGLGGYVLASGRPAWVNDYENATSITHDYDDPVLGEGIRGVLASPVLVRGSVRGVLYAGVRTDSALADNATDALTRVARRLAEELRIRDEVDRRAVASPRAGAVRDDRRELTAEVRRVAHEVGDARLRDRLLRACARFDGDERGEPAGNPGSLSPRELDVLAEVAHGLTNAEVARRLELRPETVKAYLRSVMRKLDVHSRQQAVADARRYGLIR